MREVKTDGTLENWFEANGVAYGHIYRDQKGRFTDGTPVRTSTVDRIEGEILYTRNSVYKLGEKLEVVL